MQYIPTLLYQLYSESKLWVKIYVKLRWQFCPFEEIERLIPKKAMITDIGCGFGLLANYLALTSEDRVVVGIDFSKERIDSAKGSIGKQKNINFILSDIRNIELSVCDIVVMTDFLHHISFDQQEKLLKEIFLKLKSDGKLVFQDIDSSRSWKYFFTRAIDRILNIGSPLYFRNKDSWQRLLQQCGLDVKFFFKKRCFLFPRYIIYL